MTILVKLFAVEYCGATNGHKVSVINKVINPVNPEFQEDWMKDHSKLIKDSGSFRYNFVQSSCAQEISRGYRIASYSWVDSKGTSKTQEFNKIPEILEVPKVSIKDQLAKKGLHKGDFKLLGVILQ